MTDDEKGFSVNRASVSVLQTTTHDCDELFVMSEAERSHSNVVKSLFISCQFIRQRLCLFNVCFSLRSERLKSAAEQHPACVHPPLPEK